MTPRTAIVAAASLALRGLPALGQPAPVTAALHWVRAPGAERCIDGQTLARSVEARAGRAVFTSASNADRTIEGLVAPTRGGWSVTVRTFAGARRIGERALSLHGPDCAAVSDAIALVVALMIDPEGCAEGRCEPPPRAAPPPVTEPPPPPSPPTSSPPPSSPPPTAPVLSPPTPPSLPPSEPPRGAALSRASDAWVVRVSAGAAAVGLLRSPAPSVGVEVGWGARALPLSVSLALAGWIPVESSLESWSGATVRQGGAAITLGACLDPVARVSAFACVGVLGAVLYAGGAGVDAPEETLRPGVAVALRFGVQLQLGGRLSLRVTPSLLVPLSWPSYVLVITRRADGSVEDRPVAPPGAVGLGVEISLGWSFSS